MFRESEKGLKEDCRGLLFSVNPDKIEYSLVRCFFRISKRSLKTKTFAHFRSLEGEAKNDGASDK
jgi:hypothetical protein